MPTFSGSSRGGSGSFTRQAGGLVANPNAGKISRPIVPMPGRGDFGAPIAAPTVQGPNRKDFGQADRGGIADAGRDLSKFRQGFNDPTSTGAFQNLMKLTNEQTAAQESEVARHARDATSRAGYTGGFSAATRQARGDRMKALAEAGFAGAAQVRGEELDAYKSAGDRFAQLMSGYNQAQSAGNVAFGNAASSAKELQARLGMDTAGLNQQSQLAWAGAKADAQKLQSQLDSAFNNQLIDAGRYQQMSESVAAQLKLQELKLAEDQRQFNLSRSDMQAGQKREDLERARLRNERSVDPSTGQHYGVGKRPSPFNTLSLGGAPY